MNATTITEQSDLPQRVAWSLVFLAILTTGADVWGEWSAWPGFAILAPFLVLLGIIGAVVVWMVEDPASRVVQWGGLAAAVFSVIANQGINISLRHYYTTDSAAFNHIATDVLLRGHDPYSSSMAGAAGLLQTASNYWTYTLGGGHVTQVSYPAGSFLFLVPLMALGVHHLTVDWLDLAAWIATSVVLFRILPSTVRWLAPLLLMADAFVATFANGGTDALFIPFLVLALWRWDRFVWTAPASVANWLGPVSLGVACSIKQSPWFCVPFLLVAIGLEARAAGISVGRTTLRYATIAGGAFLAINLPFILWHPADWLHGVLLPLTQPLVPDGQGLVTLALHGVTGGVELRFLWVAGAFAGVGALVALALWYPHFKRTWLLVLPLVLFLPGRSLSNYLLDFFPVALVAASTVRPAPVGSGLGVATWPRRLLIATPLVGAVAGIILAFQSVPLTVRIDSVTASAHQPTFQAITVTVHNDSSHSVTPNFMISIGGSHPTGFWHEIIDSGSLPLRSRTSATITIRPNSWIGLPHWSDYWVVDAYTASPAAISTSPLHHGP